MSDKKAKKTPAKKQPAAAAAPAPKKSLLKRVAGAKPKEEALSIKEELLQASGEAPQDKKESTEDFVVRICAKISEIPDEAYNKLSDAAKNWFQAAAEAINSEKLDTIPSLDGAKEEEAPADKGNDKTDDEPAPATKGKASSKKDEAPAPKGRASASADDHVPQKSPSAVARIITCEHMGEITLEDLKAELKKRGVKITDNQVHAVHNITRRVIKTLKLLGKIKG